ncbi:hypothetical protein DEJ39_03490 [Bacteroidetes bacterium SCGC AAA795-G10]|nr:hypothetical protein DEJ39_03490 [Bacteroidetes bacterium SCGC AAA795-G10]
MKMRLVSFLIFSLSICFINKSISQEYEKVNGLWNAAFVDLPISKKISFRTEFHSRTISYFGIWDQQLLRPQFSYKSSKNVSWRAGYTLIKNFDQDNTADPRIRREHNIWEQVEFTAPLNKSSFRTWIRLEHRFQENLPLQKNRRLKTFDFSSRLRFRLTYSKNLSKEDAKTTWDLIIYDEIFSLLNTQGIPYKFNQNWTFLGFNIKFNNKLNVLTGFQKNTILKASSNYLINRFWNTIIFYKI